MVLFDSVLVADALGMSSLIKDKSPEELLKALPRLIKSWNFVDANQQPMPITAESLGLLSVDALTVMATVLTEKIQAAVEAKKKATKA